MLLSNDHLSLFGEEAHLDTDEDPSVGVKMVEGACSLLVLPAHFLGPGDFFEHVQVELLDLGVCLDSNYRLDVVYPLVLVGVGPQYDKDSADQDLLVPVVNCLVLDVLLVFLELVDVEAVEDQSLEILSVSHTVELVSLDLHSLLNNKLNPSIEHWQSLLVGKEDNLVVELGLLDLLVDYVLVERHYHCGLQVVVGSLPELTDN